VNSGTGSQIGPNNALRHKISLSPGQSAPAGLICIKVAFGSGISPGTKDPPGPRKITSETDGAGTQSRGGGDSPD
jgi:hypothetical protein